jgi:hypothetical protein
VSERPMFWPRHGLVIMPTVYHRPRFSSIPFGTGEQKMPNEETPESKAGEFVDKNLKCADCKQPFVLTAGEQEWFEQRDMHMPRRCKECRARKKAGREGGPR